MCFVLSTFAVQRANATMARGAESDVPHDTQNENRPRETKMVTILDSAPDGYRTNQVRVGAAATFPPHIIAPHSQGRG